MAECISSLGTPASLLQQRSIFGESHASFVVLSFPIALLIMLVTVFLSAMEDYIWSHLKSALGTWNLPKVFHNEHLVDAIPSFVEIVILCIAAFWALLFIAASFISSSSPSKIWAIYQKRCVSKRNGASTFHTLAPDDRYVGHPQEYESNPFTMWSHSFSQRLKVARSGHLRKSCSRIISSEARADGINLLQFL